ncbi:alpha/beta hydrolase [Shewanella olleyana]|uniref:alpha/beta fold hydrolase n=1 Tax=Shewanella olleyana TaxID=135626 RepID=UPI00201039C3|nr:alpha/beta hydrolase [Shewanella olleyana]MCL1066463.1 alpha/beta hydrolase [Shewanella olleyana]
MQTLTKWLNEGYFHKHSFAKNFENNVFVKQAGDKTKPTLLLIHGFPTSSYDWQPIWDELTHHFHLVTLDMMGFGYSDKPTDFPYSFDAQANLIEDVLTSIEIQQVHILSHDYGNTVTQELLARQVDAKQNNSSRPFEVLSSLLLNGGIFPEVIHPILIQKLLLSPIGFIVAKAMSYRAFKRNFDDICHIRIDELELRKYWQLIQHNQGNRIFHKLIQYMKERVKHRDRWVGALINNQQPMRFINGLEDPISGRDMLKRYQELINQADAVSLERVGHYPQVEAPELVLEHAFSFWKSHKIINGLASE